MNRQTTSGIWLLVGVSAALLPVFAGVGFAMSGLNGLWAALVSLLAVLPPAIGALVVAVKTAGTKNSLGGALAGTLIRPFIALTACVVLAEAAPQLMQARAGEMVAIWYLVLLFVETLTAVRLISPPASAPNTSV